MAVGTEFPNERPQYPTLATAVHTHWVRARRDFRSLRSRWFEAARLTEPRKAPNNLSPEQLLQIQQAIDAFIAAFIGGTGLRFDATNPDTPSTLKDSIRAAYQVGVGRGAGLLGMEPDLQLLRSQQLSLYRAAFIRMSEGTRTRLADRLDEVRAEMVAGFERGDNPLVIAQSLSNDMNGIELGRVRTIIRTEMGIAAETGIRHEYTRRGVQEVEVIGDPKTDEACTSRIGNRYAMTDTDNLPLYHPNCFCSLVPIVANQ